MDSDRFDDLLRSFSTSPTRRGIARIALGLALAGPIGSLLGLADADAGKNRKKKRKKRKQRRRRRPSCIPECDGKTCGEDGCGGTCGSCDAGDTCLGNGSCAQTCEFGDDCAEGCTCSPGPEGSSFVDLCTDTSIPTGACDTPECDSSADCPSGQRCLLLGCGNRCVNLCGA